MRCQRCRGLLTCETFDDLNIETDSLHTATRCVNCGCIEDAVVRASVPGGERSLSLTYLGRGIGPTF